MFKQLALILSMVCSAGAFGQTHQHGSAPAGEGNFNPFVASDNRGGFYLAYVQRSGGENNLMLRHSAGGNDFSSPVRVNDRAGDAAVRNENPPKVAAAPNGDIYVCWANERARWKGNILFARSTDGGKTFSRSAAINSDAGAEPAGHAFQSIAVDRKGRIYIAWVDERNKKPGDRGAEIWMSTSDDGGRTFSHNRKILSDVCECCRTGIQIDSAGRLFMSYRTVPPVGPMLRDIVVARSTDGGKTFTTRVVSSDGWEIDACPVAGPGLCLDKQDQVSVIWFTGGGNRPGLYYATSTDHGETYSPRNLLDPEQKMGKHAQAIISPGGKILVAWDDFADGVRTVWGTLDPKKKEMRKSNAREGVSYPTVAVSGNRALIAGMQVGTRDIFLSHESLP